MRSTRTLQQLGYSGLASFIGVVAAILAGQYYILNFSQEKSGLINHEIIFIVLILALIASLFFALLYPRYQRIYASYKDLIQSEDSAKSMASQLSKLYDELGKSYQDLEAVNHQPAELSILLKLDIDGNILQTSDKFREILLLDTETVPANFYSWLEQHTYREDFIEQLKSLAKERKSWNGEIKATNDEGDFVWFDLVVQPVPLNKEKSQFGLLVIGTDISNTIEAKQRSREINLELVNKRVKEQQYRSVLILEGQEEERKRIAQEIHDGIGQMLTGLKLNLEGITTSSSPHMRQRMSDTKHLMKSIIKEVRRVSFNLAPSSLVDFGIVPALKKISQETTSLTSTEVVFENKTGFINRLDGTIETNLYRIIQEAVNNGIKYAKADQIKITLEHTINQLTVNIEDNGKGFDIKKLENVGHFGASGHGIFNMKERAAYINAKLDIDTKIGQGTSITISLPLT
ncbi:MULTISPECIES: PAS domain-containing sensor histidine kinase [Reichenbachiella]|uniref:histidine kinase n=1 Tax=Reichenbachiella agariperforans TaxID=156994 RepID=A0A1M6JU25_REIAG|nr:MULTISPECIES: ATP-binding protein [Reichenbachiella]MBU2913303.1 histidine kinase [Reichenbachiella agariperforans]RJE74710.1 hypothetical protein BGP76_16385 [Reichenbachiella sp. MSK19-1]SHJ50188.1 Histidine kinase-, DNA gyrase B-, and HSP90-like ATPase [Reichenbachiella agariperforans]